MNEPALLTVQHATPESWRDIETLFGRAGASNGCWCQYWLLGPDYYRRDRAENRRDLARQIDENRAGLLAYRDGTPVGWARFTQRSELRWLTVRFPAYEFGEGDPWVLSCFFVERSARGTGVMRALSGFAVQWADEHGASVEGYPIDPSVESATRNRFPGVLSTFLDSGFTEVGRLAKDRVVVQRKRS